MADGDSILSPGGYPGQEGITQQQGYDMISAVAQDAEQRRAARIPTDEELTQAFRKFQEEQTPSFDNRCKTKGCGGSVVKQVTGMFRGHINYGTPQCEKCHRVYINAIDAPGIGVEEFLKQLQKPTTI